MSLRQKRNTLEYRIKLLKTERDDVNLFAFGLPLRNIYGEVLPHVMRLIEINAHIENYEREIEKLGNIELNEIFGEWTDELVKRFPGININTIVQKVPIEAFDGNSYREIASNYTGYSDYEEMLLRTQKMIYISFDTVQFAVPAQKNSFDYYYIGYSPELDKLVYCYIPDFY